MDWLTQALWNNGRFLGLELPYWKGVGWIGNTVFFSRFAVQWWATERQKRVVIPSAFWWLSLAGSGCLLIYSIAERNAVFFFAYAFTWVPYIRNLVISRRDKEAHVSCPNCENLCPPKSQYCPSCGTHVANS